MTKPGRVLLGHISAAHGIRGEVVIKTHTANPADIAAYGPLADAQGQRSFSLKVVRVSDKGVVARIDGVADRNAAEALRGTELYVDRARLPAGGEAEYYHADLVGLEAVDPAGTPVGRVVAVHNFGAGDVLEIELVDGGAKTEMIAFSKACVPDVDIAAGRLVVVVAED